MKAHPISREFFSSTPPNFLVPVTERFLWRTIFRENLLIARRVVDHSRWVLVVALTQLCAFFLFLSETASDDHKLCSRVSVNWSSFLAHLIPHSYKTRRRFRSWDCFPILFCANSNFRTKLNTTHLAMFSKSWALEHPFWS